MSEYVGDVTFLGTPLTRVGDLPALGAQAPDATVLDNELNPTNVSALRGSIAVLVTVPSLDTPVCDTEVRRFNVAAAELGSDVRIVVVSMDLPFAQARWCGAAGVAAVSTVSDHLAGALGTAYGVLIKELRLLARSIFVIDREGVLRYAQLVKEVSDEPDYEAVLAADATSQGGSWADPEDVSKLGDSLTERAKAHDDSGRPLNPRGRTGIAGRGLLGRWGPNEAIAALVTRENIDSGGTDVLLGRKVGQHSLSVPKGFRLAGEEMDSALLRVLEEDSGWRPSSVGGEVVLKGYSYDPRQTDHAWVKLEARHIQVDGPDAPALFRPGQQFEDMAWVPMNEESLGKLVPAHAPILQAAMAKLGDRTATLSAQGS